MERDYFPLRKLTYWAVCLGLLVWLVTLMYDLHAPGLALIVDWNHHPLPANPAAWFLGLVIAGRALAATGVIALIVLGLQWRYRAVSNARQLDATIMRFTPGWAIFWIFVPVLGAIIDGLIVLQLWRASHRSRRAAATIVWIWWPLSLLAEALGYLAAWLPHDATVARWLDGVLNVPVTMLGATVALLTLALMRAIQRAQDAAAPDPVPQDTTQAA